MDPRDLEFILGLEKDSDEVRKSDGFDLPKGAMGSLRPFDAERGYPYPACVNRYARFGVHNYNMIHGSTLEVHHLEKFNMTMNCMASYYITLVAFDPEHTHVTLQIGVAEGGGSKTATCSLNVSCFVARPAKPPEGGHPSKPERKPFLLDHFRVPYWPSDFNDSQRFYMVNESVFQESNSWIRLVLELVLCTNDKGTEESDLAHIKILKVAKETIIDTEETVEHFYITFKGFALARVGKSGGHIERKVIVRSTINHHTGYMTLLGDYGFAINEKVVQRFIPRRQRLII